MWDKFKVRCSAIGKVMANSRSNPCLTPTEAVKLANYEKRESLTDNMKDEMAELLVKKANGGKLILSDTCIEYLMEVYAWEKEGMIPVNKESMDMWQIKKGKMQESQAIKLLSFIDDEIYKVHKDRISNEYLTGEIDCYLGESVYEATNITDIKNASDYPIFLKKINTGIENGQNKQVQGYCDITHAPVGYIANCLVDTPQEIIEEMKYKISKKMGCLTTESPEFLEEWKKWERSLIFQHIPVGKRVFKIKVEPFTEFEQQALYDRVKVCREWLYKFDEQYEKLNN